MRASAPSTRIASPAAGNAPDSTIRVSASASPVTIGSPRPPAPAAAGTGEGLYRFASDGQTVYFTTSERTNLWSWRIGAAEATKVTNFSDASIVTGGLSADGRAMLVSRGPVTQDAFLIRNFR